jgi:hypothetical protein
MSRKLLVTLASSAALVVTSMLGQCQRVSGRGDAARAFSGPLAVITVMPALITGIPDRSHRALPYEAVLVDGAGRIVGRVRGTDSRQTLQPDGMLTPWQPTTVVSASDYYLYYLDGAGSVRRLDASGQTQQVATIPAAAATVSGFAVSPDDRRIAVTTIAYMPVTASRQGQAPSTFAQLPARERVYVEDLASGKQTELYTTTLTDRQDRAVWPVAWTGARLVLAVENVDIYPARNPTGADNGYHVADATTGVRVATLCADGLSVGAPTPAGALCLSGRYAAYRLTLESWSGKCVTGFPLLRLQAAEDFTAGVAPDGSQIEATAPSADLHWTFTPWIPAGVAFVSGSTVRSIGGFLDTGHLILGDIGMDEPGFVENLMHATLTQIPLSREETTNGIRFVGVLPGDLHTNGSVRVAQMNEC